MQDIVVGRSIRLARLRRRWRQADLAARAGVSTSTVSRIERGRMDDIAISTLRRVCAPLEITVEVSTRGRGADLDRLVNARHSALHESVARVLAKEFGEWTVASEVSFNVWGERGVIDLLLWHPGRRALLIIELKTELVDPGAMLATMDRRLRLAGEIAGGRGWEPESVSAWIVLARSRTNERHLAAHRTMVRGSYPADGHRVRAWLRDPDESIRALSLWDGPDDHPTPFAPGQRCVRRRGRATGPA